MSEVNCSNQPVFRYTWPGQDEQYTCLEHAEQIANIANAMGCHIQFIPLRFAKGNIFSDDINRPCYQKVKVEEKK